MELENALSALTDHSDYYNEIEQFSDKPGLYAFYYAPSDDSLPALPFVDPELVYIGKTQSGQAKRNANTHFKSGKSGSSTFRRSLGAILIHDLRLVPVPRNDSDAKKGRTNQFTFDAESEDRLTEWMMRSIKMSYFEFEGDNKALNLIETEVIRRLVPPLNISKNPENRFKNDIQRLRSNCASLAHNQTGKVQAEAGTERAVANRKLITKKKETKMGTGLYSTYWESKLPEVKNVLRTGRFDTPIKLRKVDFDQLGNRKSFFFNIQFKGAEVENNLTGSAVARDLRDVMLKDVETRALLSAGRFKIRMGNDFELWITKN